MKDRIFWGLVLVLVGIGLLLDKMSIIVFSDVIGLYWPCLLILSAIVGLIFNKNSRFGNLLLLIFAVILQVDKLDLVNMNLFSLIWPIILISLGLNMLFSNKKSYKVNYDFNIGSKKYKNKDEE